MSSSLVVRWVSGNVKAGIRVLDLGHRNAGYYRDRAGAAYWDGRNDDGEPVVSGVYMIELRAGSYRAMRRIAVTK